MLQSLYIFICVIGMVLFAISLYSPTGTLGRFVSLPLSFIFLGVAALQSGNIETISNGEVIVHQSQGLMWLWFGLAMIVFALMLVHFVSYFKTSLGAGGGI